MNTDITFCYPEIDIDLCKDCRRNTNIKEIKDLIKDVPRIAYSTFHPRESKIQGWHCDYYFPIR